MDVHEWTNLYDIGYQCYEEDNEILTYDHEEPFTNSLLIIADGIKQTLDDQVAATASTLCSYPIVQGPASPYLADVPFMPSTPSYYTNASSNEYNSSESVSDSIAEALKSEKINSLLDVDTQIKPAVLIKEDPVVTNSVIVATYLRSNYPEYLTPKVERKPRFTAKKPKSAPRSQKPKKTAPKASVASRITMAQGFEQEVPEQEDGMRYIHRAEADQVALRVKARQFKISGAGRKSEGKGGKDRAPYTKLHDALKKAQWKREVVGDFYRYYK